MRLTDIERCIDQIRDLYPEGIPNYYCSVLCIMLRNVIDDASHSIDGACDEALKAFEHLKECCDEYIQRLGTTNTGYRILMDMDPSEWLLCSLSPIGLGSNQSCNFRNLDLIKLACEPLGVDYSEYQDKLKYHN